MKEITNSLPDSSKKISRKKFFMYAGASAAGVFALTKLPFNIFKSKIESEAKSAASAKFKENPLAVKRTINAKSNG